MIDQEYKSTEEAIKYLTNSLRPLGRLTILEPSNLALANIIFNKLKSFGITAKRPKSNKLHPKTVGVQNRLVSLQRNLAASRQNKANIQPSAAAVNPMYSQPVQSKLLFKHEAARNAGKMPVRPGKVA
jgi:hypothetical protein